MSDREEIDLPQTMTGHETPYVAPQTMSGTPPFPPSQPSHATMPPCYAPPPAPYGYVPYPPYPYYPPVPPRKTDGGFAVASLVLGILSLIPVIGFFTPAILGLIFGIVSRAKGDKSAKSIIGIVFSAIGLLFASLLIWLLIEAISSGNLYHFPSGNFSNVCLIGR